MITPYDYQNILSAFCQTVAKLARITENVDAGECVKCEEVNELKVKLIDERKSLLLIKEKLGYGGGLSFLEDNNFVGFSIKDGMLIGDRNKVEEVIMKWLNFDENSQSQYKYEVANYILSMFYYGNEYD